MDNCIFCKIIAKEIPAYISYEDSDVIVFQSLVNTPLIVPKKHLVDIFELDDDLGSKIMQTAINLAPIVKSVYGADGIFIMQNNGAAAGQEVFHYHMHVVPKWTDKKVPDNSEEAKITTTDRIKLVLEK